MASSDPVNSPQTAAIAAHYDATMYQQVFLEYYGHSNFSNFGYWDIEGQDQKGACEALMKKLLGLYSGSRQGRVLDVACGKGGTTKHLLDLFEAENISAVNISSKQLDSASAVAPGCHFAAMDAVQLGYKDASFDLVVCVEAAFHFVTRKLFFAEAQRILKPGGTLLLTDILMNIEAETRLPYRTPENFVAGPDDYASILRSRGFEHINVIDVTKECWHGCYWNMVRLAHAQFLARRIDAAMLRAYLEKAYRMVEDIEYYLLVSAQKKGD